MKPIWIVVIAVLGTGIVAVGLTYYLINSAATRDKDDLQTQISSLSTKLSDTEGSLSSALSSSSSSSSDSSSSSSSAAVTSSSSSSATVSSAFSLTNLKAASVVVSGTTYKLTDGIFKQVGDGPFNPEIPATITLDQKNYAVDTANANQAAIILALGGMRHVGATVNPTEIEIMTNNAGTPKYAARVLLDGYYECTVNSIAFASNIVTVNFTRVGTTTVKTVSYKLNANNTLTMQ